MIRHSSSLFISLFIHLLLIGLAFFIYFSQTSKNKVPKEEKRVLIQLTTLVKKKQNLQPPLQKATIQKTIKKKLPLKKKTIKKKKIKKVLPKKKRVKKRIIVTKKEKTLTKTTIQEESKKVKNPPKATVQKQKYTKIETEEKKDTKLQKRYIDNNLAKIRTLIKDNLYYPRRARKKHIVGDVIVKFTLAKDATVSNIIIISSQHKILSRSAIKTIEDLSSSFPKPKEKLTLQLPINYSLK